MKVDRRRFLTRSALAFGAVAAGELVAAKAAHTPAAEAATDPLGGVRAVRRPAPGGRADRAARRGGARRARRRSPPIARAARLGLQALSNRARELTQGFTLATREVDEPPLDSGALGTEVAPDALTVTIGFGASLFDALRPRSRPRSSSG